MSPYQPITLGHEIAGTITDVGSAVPDTLHHKIDNPQRVVITDL